MLKRFYFRKKKFILCNDELMVVFCFDGNVSQDGKEAINKVESDRPPGQAYGS